jgi:hypothetical protein
MYETQLTVASSVVQRDAAIRAGLAGKPVSRGTVTHSVA